MLFIFKEDERLDTGMYEKFREMLNEVETAKREAFEESNKRRKAERDLLSALQMVNLIQL